MMQEVIPLRILSKNGICLMNDKSYTYLDFGKGKLPYDFYVKISSYLSYLLARAR